MMQFISMGANCEFGYAQRLCEAEPFDLLRWASTGMPALLLMLHDRFAGLGDPSALTAEIMRGEFMLRHNRYNFLWHSFQQADATTADRVLKRELRRLPHQAEMLLQDMAEGERILVRVSVPGMLESKLPAFVAACGALGPSQILYVTQSPARAGKVDRIGKTLLHGHIARLADPARVTDTTDKQAWVALCREAYAHAKQQC